MNYQGKTRAQSAGRLQSSRQEAFEMSPSSPMSRKGSNSDLAYRQGLTAGLSPMSDKSMGTEILDAKLNRKRAESDLQLLANRIALLKLEEQKALSKVQETKSRAQEILE
jgi:hypothetical protein